MTDITELAKAAEKYRSTLEAHRNNPRDGVALNAWDDATSKFMELVDNDELNIISGLLEALEKAKGMETYWKTQCRGITDHCEELQARIAELESHTVKPPVHPTVASENLDDETLQELIEFRRTTFEYHSKEGNKVQTIIHGVTLAALRELQERRKADSEPVAEVVSIYGDPEAFGEREIRPLVGIQQMPYGTKLYRHAQPVPVVSADLLHTAASAIEDLLEHTDPNTSYYSGVWADVPGKLRAAMFQAKSLTGNSPVIGIDLASGPDRTVEVHYVAPPGYVMVPKEPTEAMMLHNSGCQHHAWDDPDCAMRQTRRLIWSHMLAAAPQEVK
ncbi:hypothetical protein DMS95_21005 [Klebsiella variicola]|uniref:hypothetical protein n=1 Tax=Klebsiella variicola TaxID=244366 RepID=UPI000D74F3A3|nr:hypothetical protein [Klebsiella variicola]PXL91866.1 hypothetical protein DMS95_21005 [Klebsiella variicola]